MKVDNDYAYQQGLRDWLGAQQDVLRDLERQLSKLPDGADASLLNAAISQAAAGVESIKAAQRSISTKEWGQNISSRSSDQARQVIYGRARVGGVWTFGTLNQGETGQFFHQIHTLACHKILGFRKLYFDNEEISFATDIFPNLSLWSSGAWENLVFFSGERLGDESQSANSHAVSQSAALFPGLWTTEHRQRGCAHAYIISLYDFERFPNGDPSKTMLLDGHVDIYDPRDDSTGWTDNACLVIAEYLTNSNYGPGYGWSEIDTSADYGGLQYAADVCDETIATAEGGTEKRYTINGAFRVTKGNSHKQILDDMFSAIAGSCRLIEGKWRFFPGAWVAPSVALDENDILSKLSIDAKPSKTDIFNAIKGKYRGEKTNWEWSDYPYIKNSTYQNQDGERIFLELDQPFVTSPSACQRLAKIRLEKARQWIKVSGTFGPRALNVRKGDNVTLTYGRFGWAEKNFEVMEVSISSDTGQGAPVVGVKLVLQETAPGVYDWNDGDETVVDLAPNTSLTLTAPNAPSGLELISGSESLDIRADGTIFTRLKVSWTLSADPAVLYSGRYEIQYKKSTSAKWLTAGYTDGGNNEFYILDVAETYYDARVRAITYRAGAWATVYGHLVVGKSEAPSTPVGLTVSLTARGVEISWQPVSDLDLDGYDVRVGDDWVSAELVAKLKSTFVVWPTQAVGRIIVRVAAFDTSGNYSDLTSAEIDINAPSAPGGFAAAVINNMVQLTWLEPSSLSFPVLEYQLYRVSGAVETSIGRVKATIKTLFESVAGTYTYRVRAVDAYGNIGSPSDVSVYVQSPPLFALLSEKLFLAEEAIGLSNAVVDGSYIVMPVNATETLAGHFDGNSWATPQEQVDAGYQIFIQPSVSGDGQASFVVDFGETIGGCVMRGSIVGEWVSGSGVAIMSLGTSADNSTWSEAVDVQEIFATSFRYGKISIKATGDDDLSIFRFSQPRLRLEVKRETIAKRVEAVSSDASGTTVAFDEDARILDILEDGIQVTYNGSSARVTGYSISGNTIRVFLFDTSGIRQTGYVNVTAGALLAQL